jgi:hypothetical protein
MKSLLEFITESLKIKTKKISGSKHVKCSNTEMDFNYEIESSKWNLSTFTDSYGDKVMAYWSTESDWIFYKKDDGAWNWAAVSPGDVTADKFNEHMFTKFDDMLMNGATIPEFDKFDSDLKG